MSECNSLYFLSPAARAFRHTPLAAALLLALAPAAFAERAANVKELPAVSILGNPEDPQSSTGSAYVLTERELQKFSSSNANDVLRSVPGVYTREENGLGVFPRISIRAASTGRSDRISVLEDGIPAAMAPYANTSAYYFPNMGRMSSVEVLKGPEILMHGPHTTSGAVNLISTPIPEQAGGKLNAEYGSFGALKLHAHYGATEGQWGFLVETYQAQGDGFHDIDRSDRSAGHDIEEYMGKLRWTSDADATYAQEVELKLVYGVEVANVSYLGLTDADFKHDPNRRYGLSELEQMDRGRKSASLRHVFGFTDNTKLTTTTYWNDTYRYYDRINQINGVNLGGVTSIVNNGLANADLIQDILDGTADTTHANGVRYQHGDQEYISKGVQTQLDHWFVTGALEHELMVGVRWHEDTTKNQVKGRSASIYRQVNGRLVYDRTVLGAPQQGESEAWSGWIADRIRVGKWTWLPIVRYEDIESKANLAKDATPAQRAARNTNSLTSTTAGLGVNYALTEQWTLLAGVHEGFAPPGNGAARGTEGEESTNYEGGVRFRQGSFGVDAIGFLTDYQNATRSCLVANPCPGGIVEGTQQDGAKEVYGLEFGLFADLYQGAGFTVPLRVAYTYTDGEYTKAADNGSVLKGDVIDYTPKHIGQVQIGLEADSGWRAYAAVNYAAEAYTSPSAGRSGVDDRFLKTDSLTTLNLVASYPVTEQAEVYARLDNVFDEQAITHRGADGARGNAPRTAAVGLRLSF